jgi:hypothetical protein
MNPTKDMRIHLSTDKPDWKQDLKENFNAHARFILTGWDFALHHQECEALARQFDYLYSFDREFGWAFFTPGSRVFSGDGAIVCNH